MLDLEDIPLHTLLEGICILYYTRSTVSLWSIFERTRGRTQLTIGASARARYGQRGCPSGPGAARFQRGSGRLLRQLRGCATVAPPVSQLASVRVRPKMAYIPTVLRVLKVNGRRQATMNTQL